MARTLSFRRAAAESYTSQSALSAHVKRLEELLGVTLFERDRRRTLLTPDGERAQEYATRILQDLDQLLDAMRDDGDPLAGTLRLGVIPTVAPFLLPRLVAKVAEHHPQTHLLVYEDPTARLIARMQGGEVDAIVLDVDVDLANLCSEVVFEDALVFACGASDPFAHRNLVTLAEVGERDLLLLEEGHCLSDRIRAFCQSSATSAHGDFRATSLVTLVHMVASGTGVTLLPEIAARDFASTPGLSIIPFEPPAPSRRIGIAWRPTDRRERAFRQLAELVEECA